jgi:hypothetical protein
MALNPNIALGVRPLQLEMPNPLAQYGQIAAIQGAQNQNQLAQYQLGAAQRAEATQNVLADAYSQSINPDTGTINYNKLTGLLAKGGGGSQIPGIEKTRREIEAAALKVKETEGNIAKNEYELQQKKFTKAWQSAGAAATPQIAIDQITKAARSGEIDMATATREIQTLQKLAPEQYRDWRANKILELMDAKDQYAATVPKVMSQFEAARLPIFQQQANIAQGQLGVSQGQLGVSQGQLKVARDRLAQENQGVTYQQDAQGNFVALPSRLASGVEPVARPVTGEGGVPVKGKPSAFAEKAAAQKVQMGKDLGFAITQLSDITKDGGLIDQSTGSGAGRLADIGAGFVGKATPGAIAIGKIAPVADLVLKMVPRFEGPQSNKDTQSYKEAAGQLADPTLPTAIRKEAGKTVLRLMQERKNQFVTNDMATGGVAPAQIAPPAGFTPDQ